MTENLHRHTVIDVHMHVHPAKLGDLLEIMEANNLSRVVNLGILEARDVPFEEGMKAFRAALGPRMVYFPAPDFRDNTPGFGKRMADELERKVRAGAGGLKIFKELGLRRRDSEGNLIPVDDPRLDPLWFRAGELGVPVLIHTADPAAFFLPLNPENERWEELQHHPDWHFGGPEFPRFEELLAQLNRVIERHPRTRFIGAHLGNCAEDLAYVDGCLDRFPNYYVEISARIAEFGRHPARETRTFFIKHQDRIMFGSDLVLGWSSPDGGRNTGNYKAFYDVHWRFFETGEAQIDHPSPLQGRWKVDAIDLPGSVLDKLYVSNAQRLVRGL